MSDEQIGNALTFYAQYITSKVGTTGLTVTVSVYRNDTEIVTAAACTEVGRGLYKYQLASGSVTVEGRYVAAFTTATTTVDQRDIAAIYLVGMAGVEYLDAAVSSRARDGVTVTVANPVVANANIEIYAGDSYSDTDGRALTWTITSTAVLTSAAIAFSVANRPNGTKVLDSIAGVVPTLISGTTYRCKVELTAVQTALLTAGSPYQYDLEATIATRKLTLTAGRVKVLEDVT